MSSDTAPAATSQPSNDNAKSAEDAQRLLAELSGEVNGKSETTEKTASKISPSEETKEQNSDAKPVEETAQPEANAETSQQKEKGRDRSDRGGRGGRGRGRGGRGGFSARNTRDNIKSDLTTQEETDDPVAIRKQVEFYFSDSNLPTDKFLLEKVGGSKNNPVELKILHSFKRMRRFQPFEAIVNALKTSTFLELTDDDTCVKRKEPLPESLDDGPDADAVRVFEDKAMPRSVYVKGFGEEDKDTQFNIEAFFAPYGPTNAIRLRRADSKLFKGSVFTEFETEGLAKAFLALDPKPQYKGRDLQIMSKKEYCEKKVEDIKAGKVKANKSGFQSRGGRNDRGSGRDFKRKRDNEDDRDWRQRRDEDRKGGFKDRKNFRDRDSRGGRDRRDQKNGQSEVDDKGIPVVKADTERVEAIAKAKAAVEAESKKEEAANGETASKKRTREEDNVEEEREAKKQDTKVEESVATS